MSREEGEELGAQVQPKIESPSPCLERLFEAEENECRSGGEEDGVENTGKGIGIFLKPGHAECCFGSE